ncbi:EcsC family protein [Halobacillus yeomjeoni]|uniref:EcsC family protein n=1 Tax=Halobacillus yeomjeoni TaxID=311194 RepID=A0A931HVB3_9BACI|nr:EcsC family protein [Halobacillus yeomjeoni]MBH0230155.1 EcsC family protein [Halobacillus yeomjeoni]MCA0982476.1 EcsC family protein [Halobacillus yeomjeoni]
MSQQRVHTDVKKWLKQYQNYQANDFERVYDDWMHQTFDNMDPGIKEKFFSKLDTWFFHTHAFLQGTSFQMDARERILTLGRVFAENVDTIEDLQSELTVDQLTYIANQQITRGRLYSFAQGGLTGTGGWLLLGLDYPLMMLMNIRAVQLVGLTFGHEMNHPYEMMISLKVFHAATLPKRLQAAAWRDLMDEVERKENPFIFDGDDQLTNEAWLEQPIKQGFKSLFILMFRKKIFQGVPFISIAIGAYSNYQLTKQVTDFAMKFYQYRHLKMKEGEL